MITTTTDFQTVAAAALARGFEAVTPLIDKHPFTHGWNRQWALRNTFAVTMAAKDYPHSECGIVLHREVGKPFVIDVDKEDVLERMPPLPPTYAVLSRPETAPHKRHIFFLHTDYSNKKFGKNVNAGDFDLIGVGKAPLQVVAEGCVRDTGEVRVGNGLPIAPVPDEIVDWLITEAKRLQSEKRKAATRARHQIAVATGAHTGMNIVPRNLRTNFLRGMARWLVKFRVRRRDVFAELLRQCALYCEDGDKYVKTGKSKIRAIAYDRGLRMGDPLQWCPRSTEKRVVRSPRAERQQTLAKMKDSVSPGEAIEELGLKSGKNLARDMKAGGYLYDAALNIWTRGGTQ